MTPEVFAKLRELAKDDPALLQDLREMERGAWGQVAELEAELEELGFEVERLEKDLAMLRGAA